MPRSTQDLIDYANEMADRFENYELEPGDEQRPVPPEVAVKVAAYKRAYAERELTEAVRAARRSGISWRELGSLLGTSGQSAQRRYGPLIDA